MRSHEHSASLAESHTKLEFDRALRTALQSERRTGQPDKHRPQAEVRHHQTSHGRQAAELGSDERGKHNHCG